MPRHCKRPRRARSPDHRPPGKRNKKAATPKSWIAFYVLSVVVLLLCMYHAAALLEDKTLEKNVQLQRKPTAAPPQPPPAIDLYSDLMTDQNELYR